jgi:hypothetical protein
MKNKTIKNIKTKGEARQFAIDWQYNISNKSISYRELIEYTKIFEILAKKFDLTEEFKENGII